MSAPGPVRSAPETKTDWETPQALFDLLNREFHFTLDGAASFENAKCNEFYSESLNAFSMNPVGEVIYLNPPYGLVLPDWIKLATRWAHCNTVVLLVPNATDTAWFANAVWSPLTIEVRLLLGRVQFVGTTSSNPSGSVVVVMDEYARGAPKWFQWDWKTEIQKAAAA